MPASLHRKKLRGLFEENQTGVIYLKGADLMYRYDTDYEFPFRQESNFWYLTGVNEPNYDMILDLKTSEYHLFAPERDARFAVWHGRIKSREDIIREYNPDHLHYGNDLLTVLNEMDPAVVYCLNEEQAEFLEDIDRKFNVDAESLSDAITYCRCIKTEWELDQLREAARINNISHMEVLKTLKPGMYEYETKAVFDYHQIRHGLMSEAYNGIHASGPNSAILHYVENNRQMADGDLFLIDAGYESNGYSSDFSRTYPVNGKFSGKQAAVYQIVLNAQRISIEAAGPGIKMEELHMLAADIVLEGLLDIGLVRGTVDDLMENNIFALFFPHGLGHFIGLDTHDVGGYPKGVDRIDRPGLQYLRARRELLPGMVITVEPGIYFIQALLKPALEDPEKSRFLNREKIESFFDFGGIRIEDNLIITENGIENMTALPKDIREIEAVMKQARMGA
ncbi:MAG: aminopeptidase P family protein [Balneolaceae bacterium]